MIIGSEKMPSANKAEWVFLLAAPPDRAKQLAAGSLAACGSHASVPYWIYVIRTTLFEALRVIRTSPKRFAALVAIAYGVGLLLGTAFNAVPAWVVNRPIDDSLVSAAWVRETAQFCSSVFGLWIWQYFVGPLLLGVCVAWLSRGREIAAFIAVLISQFVAAIAVPLYAEHLGFSSVATVIVNSPWTCLPVLLGAIVVRRSFLWKRR